MAGQQSEQSNEMSRRNFIGKAALASAVGGAGLALGGFLPPRVAATTNDVDPTTYTVYKDVSGNWNVRDGSTGQVVYTNAVPEKAVNQAISLLPQFGRLVVKGDMTISSTITLNKAGSYEFYGDVSLSVAPGVPIFAGFDLNGANDINLFVHGIDGGGRQNGRYGIRGTNSQHTYVRVVFITNCDVGIRLDNSVTPFYNNYFFFDLIVSCNIGIYAILGNTDPIDPSKGSKEGNYFQGLIQSSYTKSVAIDSGNIGGSFFMLQIDNAQTSSASDFVNNQDATVTATGLPTLGLCAILYGNVRANKSSVQPKDFAIYTGPNAAPGLKVRAYNPADLPPPYSVPTGTIVFVINQPTGQKFQGSDGVNWFPLG